MSPDDLSLAQAFCLCGLNVVLAQYVQHTGTHETAHRSHGAKGQGKGGQDLAVPVCPAYDSKHLGSGCLSQLQSQEILKDSAHDKGRHRYAYQSQEHSAAVPGSSSFNRCNDTQKDTHDKCKEQGPDDPDQRKPGKPP